MIYTAEIYERVRKLLGDLCMVQTGDNPVAYKVSKYKSKKPVYLVEGNGGEMYLMGDHVFELERSGFDVGVSKEKEVLVMLFKFSTRSLEGGRRVARESPEEGQFIEVDVGPVTCDGRRMGTLIASSIPQGLCALSSVLKRFIRIDTNGYSEGGFEKLLVRVLSSNRVL
ncbi:putative UDP-Gal beta GlcNAC beta 1,4 galactosyltransferase-like protein [Encephalitozoon intestinalis ATCC 50506]|uniref:UDP-Gal beta GlcNAC beta 1,4 galactosyltransferase-like protein n=1 Tax=Encephalitozoon intestinalis (strain ATCC 50506) TaxID=876142 RepID=E0S6R4_ENCIT|nr:putative UDP-Gal beta GlcNAC beta 1,4 galactosyltransferase-like protein [Encephalitozoon intestinalis ATCC 50506]ADM11399.1 putative UDP-Gal beta GlcNAC beta 1,4 galactosyltransferase-like protein [Encephalitozoon intestinalis ATCC 50506]UTX45090.1 hypothetical protein GPK93_04g06280 [Encephalitozoon intestinalis]